MKIYFSAVAALLLVGETAAFSTSSPFRRTTPVALSNTATREKESGVDVQQSDVSVPYDAAARLAYDEWRATYSKGNFDAGRFESFKSNYNMLTVANVSAAKQARDAGEEVPKAMELNEFADMSFEEYEAMNAGEEQEQEKEQSVSVLETAMAGSAAQQAAASSLEEAAAALAEEEQVRV